MKKGLIITISIIIVVIAAVWGYKAANPGVWFKYKCNEGGDDTRKPYGDNWQARGALCDGLYIPFGVKTNGKDKGKILQTMASIYNSDNSTKSDMKKLATDAVAQVS